MTNYNIRYKDDHLAHAGRKGMKWGYNDGVKNGRRTAEEFLNDLRDNAELVTDEIKRYGRKTDQAVDDTRYRYRLNRNGLLDKQGRTLIKYGLNKVGDGRLDDKLSRAHRNVKKKVKKIKKEINRRIKENGGIVSSYSRIGVGDDAIEKRGKNGKWKRVKR